MASTSSSGHAERVHIDIDGQGCEMNSIGDQFAGPFNECMQDIPHAAVSTTIVLEPSSKLQVLATWLLGYMRYTCGVLGSLGTCLPLIQVDQRREEASVTRLGENHEPGVLVVDRSNVADSAHSLDGKHKVFLSHSSAQKDFVEQLCVDLRRCDRYPFFDKLRSSLPIGEKFPKLIFYAIEQCRVGVVILSEEFFMRSKWPMLELNAMVKEFEKPNPSIRIIPVFYVISINAFKDAQNHRRWIAQWKEWARNDERINVDEWKTAVRVMVSMSSLVLKEGYGDLKLREEIVSEVCQLVPPETKWDDSHVEGRLRSCKVIRDKMDQVSINLGVTIVGLYGVGGIGKTTISKALCNDLSPKFYDNVCHIELGSGSEMELLWKALKKLTHIRHDVLNELDDIGQGYAFLKKNLHSQPIFFVLDNVQDDYKSMEVAKTYLKVGYGCGSMVLVIARSLEVLKKLNLDESDSLEMPELEEEEARSLFLNHADLPSGIQVDEVLIKNCLKQCHFLKTDGRSKHYHPLALKVLGQELSSNSTGTKLEQCWAEQLSKINVFNQLGDKEHPIFSILEISFDSLKREHQLVFMDLALSTTSEYNDENFGFTRRDWLCMVHEETVEDMMDILEVLKRKSLLEDLSNDFTKIGIHDLWIEFAVAETKPQDSRDRRWVYQIDGRRAALGRRGRWRENVERMWFTKEGWRGLKGLNLDDFVNVEAFTLQVDIYMADCVLDLDLSGLRHLKSLVLDTRGLAVRADGLSSLANLAFLTWNTRGFSPCLDDIGRLTYLQVLILLDCKGIEVLDLTELKLLQVVQIGKFPDLITVSFSSRLSKLRYVQIEFCQSLRECPGLGELYALKILHFCKCGKIENLPHLGQLTELRELHLRKCNSLRAVPGLRKLAALEYLTAPRCSKLAGLPDLVKFTKLRILDIWMCPMRKVPGLDGLLSLTVLRASFYLVVGEQPVLSKLSALKDIDIHGWNGPIWSSIRSLLMLERLCLIRCKGEDVVPDLHNLKRLKSVYLWICEFKDLSGLSNSTALESFTVHGCAKLERLPEFERLTKLRYLRVLQCDDLREWPCASNLCSLQSLSVDGLTLMKVVGDLETLKGLRNLELCGLGWNPGWNVLSIAPLSQLESLKIFNFSTMEALDASIFPRLKELWLVRCNAFKRLTCSTPLTALNELVFRECESLVEMPDLSGFPQLEKLSLENCGSLRRVTCSRSLTDLKDITLIACDSGVEMPDLCKFPKLKLFRREDYSDDERQSWVLYGYRGSEVGRQSTLGEVILS